MAKLSKAYLTLSMLACLILLSCSGSSTAPEPPEKPRAIVNMTISPDPPIISYGSDMRYSASWQFTFTETNGVAVTVQLSFCNLTDGLTKVWEETPFAVGTVLPANGTLVYNANPSFYHTWMDHIDLSISFQAVDSNGKYVVVAKSWSWQFSTNKFVEVKR